MDCREIQKSIIPFIDDKLDIRDLEAFLRHMDNCENCREEYDVYYTMIAGMRYLEGDNAEAFNFDSWQKLQSAEDYLLKYRLILVAKIMAFVFLCIGAVWFL